MHQILFQEDSKIDVLDNSSRYNFTLDNYTVINGMTVYILQFTPKGGKDFKGTMYVNTQDFAIVRLDFENVKPLSNFALLGITYRNNIYKGKMLFDKDENGSYSPRFLELLDGSYMGFDRPVKVIEKNNSTTIGLAHIATKFHVSRPLEVTPGATLACRIRF